MNSISMTYQELFSPQLQQLIGRIATTPMNGHKSYEVSKISRMYKDKLKGAREEYNKLVEDIVEFDSAGIPQYNFDEKTGEQSLKFKEGFTEKSEEFLNAIKTWEQTSVTFDLRPWTLNVLGEVKLSVADFETLGKFFSYEETPILKSVK